jgi:hypothetical protein
MRCNYWLQKKALKEQKKHSRKLRRSHKKHDLGKVTHHIKKGYVTKFNCLVIVIQLTSLTFDNCLFEAISYLTVDDFNMYYNYLHTVVMHENVNVNPLDEINYIT